MSDEMLRRMQRIAAIVCVLVVLLGGAPVLVWLVRLWWIFLVSNWTKAPCEMTNECGKPRYVQGANGNMLYCVPAAIGLDGKPEPLPPGATAVEGK